jgi:fucose 4-O-acetylase-like acetyltransferase
LYSNEFIFAKNIERLLYNLSEVAVPLFFFISAYLYFFDFTGNLYAIKLKKRVYTLLIPYVFYNIIFYIEYIVMHKSIEQFNLIDLFDFIVLGKSVLWFMRELILFTILGYVIWRIIDKKIIFLSSICLSIIFSIFGFFPYKSIGYWWGIYLIGAYFGKNNYKLYKLEKNIEKKLTYRLIMMFLFILIILSFFMPNFKDVYNVFINVYYLIFRYICILLIWIIVLFFNKKIQKIKGYMKCTFVSYCWHSTIIAVVQILLNKVIHVNNSVLYIFTYFVTIIFTYLIINMVYVLMKKHTPRLLYFLNGFR